VGAPPQRYPERHRKAAEPRISKKERQRATSGSEKKVSKRVENKRSKRDTKEGGVMKLQSREAFDATLIRRIYVISSGAP